MIMLFVLLESNSNASDMENAIMSEFLLASCIKYMIKITREVDRKFKYVLKVLVLSQQPVSLCNLPLKM
jgi:hypothetical protein